MKVTMGRMKTVVCGAIVSFAMGLPALAQSVVGRAIVDGRTVVLYDNQTWGFETPQTGDCASIGLGISFCGAADRWVNQGRQMAPVLGLYRYDAVHYGQIVAEDVGLDQGITLELFRRVVLENAASFAGIPNEQVTTLDVQQSEIDGYKSETITYALEINGTPFVFINTLVLEANRNYQLVTFALGAERTPIHAELNEDFLSLIDLPEDDK